MQIAQTLADYLSQSKPEFIKEAKAVNGYLNIFLSRNRFTKDVLADIINRSDDFAAKKSNGKTITIDFSSVNIAKPFHIGHLLTTVIGGSLCRIFRHLGYNVVGINHLGDWGTQFGKLIAATKRWGDVNSVSELSKLYVKFHDEAERDPSLNDLGRDWFRRIEEGDAEALKMFHKFKDITLKEVNEVYRTLDITFDSYDGESFFNDKMQPVIDMLEQKGLLSVSEGAKVVDLSAFDMPPCLILKSDGASLYATRDLAAAIYRKKTYNFDQNLYVVAYQQNLHFKQVFKVLELLGFDWANGCRHVPFGMVSLEGGGALSTRKGNVVLLKDVISAAVSKTRDIIDAKNPTLEDKDSVANDIGVGAVIFMALFNGRIKDMTFSLDKALSFEGETGPYVQYTHARCCSVLAKADESLLSGEIDYSVLESDDAYDVVRHLSQFDFAVEDAAARYEPSSVSRYLVALSQSFNRFYIGSRIIGEDRATMAARLRLTKCVKNVLKNGLKLILLKAPTQM